MKSFRKYFIFLIGFLSGILVSVAIGSYIFLFMFKPYYQYELAHTKIQIGSGLEDSLFDKIKTTIFSLPLQVSDKWQKLNTVWQILSDQYYDPKMLKFDNMREEAIKGFVGAIGDPFTVYLTKQENSNFQQELKGTQDFEGIGAVVTKVEQGIMIEQVLKGYPAYKAGLRPLDIIIKINGQPTKNMSLSEAVSKIRGPAGTYVTLTIYRPSENRIFEIKIKREKIEVPSVTYDVKVLTGGLKVGYINVSIIGEDTERNFKKAIDDLRAQGVKGFILDLRGNGGGYLQVAVEMASHFIPKGKIIVTTKYRVYPDEVYKSYGYGDAQGYPVVVLVDGLTASAAEIISAALRDDIGAKLVGTKTFGKCTVQTMKEFDDGSSLKYTIGKRFTPKGKSVCSGNTILPGGGLKPDIKVDFDKNLFIKKHIDNQLKTAEKVIYDMINKK